MTSSSALPMAGNLFALRQLGGDGLTLDTAAMGEWARDPLLPAAAR